MPASSKGSSSTCASYRRCRALPASCKNPDRLFRQHPYERRRGVIYVIDINLLRICWSINLPINLNWEDHGKRRNVAGSEIRTAGRALMPRGAWLADLSSVDIVTISTEAGLHVWSKRTTAR